MLGLINLKVNNFAKNTYNFLQSIRPAKIRQSKTVQSNRRNTDKYLSGLASGSVSKIKGTVLVDGMWDNPAYWQAFAMFRAALGLNNNSVIGILGPWKHALVRETMSCFGFNEIVKHGDFKPEKSDVLAIARKLISETKSSDDILSWKLPYDFPAMEAYDAILKVQQTASVDILASNFEKLVVELLQNILAAAALIEKTNPELVYVSHAMDDKYGALSWIALQKGIDVVIGLSFFGAVRYTRLRHPDEIYDWLNRPSPEEMDSITPDQWKKLSEIGYSYIQQRYAGNTVDLGATYAYQRDRKMVSRNKFCEERNWDSSKPIIAVYTSAWYDFPHTSGMQFFRDFEDWAQTTWEVAEKTTQFNWVFRAHPCEEWYDGIRIQDVLKDADRPNIAIVGAEISGAAMKDLTDVIITVHGSTALEAVSNEIPVLGSDVSWYHDCGFVHFPGSREKYKAAIAREWWKEMDWKEASEKARVFSALYYCLPQWQDGLFYDDHDKQDELYEDMQDLMQVKHDILKNEIECIGQWWESPRKFYHIYKMLQADSFMLPILRN